MLKRLYQNEIEKYMQPCIEISWQLDIFIIFIPNFTKARVQKALPRAPAGALHETMALKEFFFPN